MIQVTLKGFEVVEEKEEIVSILKYFSSCVHIKLWFNVRNSEFNYNFLSLYPFNSIDAVVN